MQVVQEKLTHVNTHAKLSMDITFKAIKAVENNIIKEGITQGIQHAMEKTIQFYNRKVEKEQQMQHSAGNNGSNMALSSNQQGIPGKVIFTIDNLLPRYRTKSSK